MRTLDVQLWVDGRDGVQTYKVEGSLKQPGEAIERAREKAAEDGHEDVNLKEVKLSEPAR